MRFRRSAGDVVETNIGSIFTGERVGGLEDDAFGMVFKKKQNVRKDFGQRGAEFIELEFMHVEGIGTGLLAGLRVVELVGRRDDELSGGSEHAASLGKEFAPGFQVLDDFEGDDEIDRAIG